jgi:hypothetical protein
MTRKSTYEELEKEVTGKYAAELFGWSLARREESPSLYQFQRTYNYDGDIYT